MKITKQDVELTLKDTEEMINTMVTRKYAQDGESTLQDVIDRICRIVKDRGKKLGYTKTQLNKCVALLKEGYFLPGGSILAGLTEEKKKSSLSNCYVLKIKKDDLESIFDVMKEMARTYSYRGGCGVDISILRPADTPVHNAARTSTGAVSFMPLLSMTTETIGQCLGAETLVLTKRGLIPICEVAVDDEVWTRQEWVKVKEVITNYKRLNKIHMKSGTSIRASDDHVFLKVTGTTNTEVESPVSNLNAGDKLVMMVGGDQVDRPIVKLQNKTNQTNYIGDELDEDLAYLVGYIQTNAIWRTTSLTAHGWDVVIELNDRIESILRRYNKYLIYDRSPNDDHIKLSYLLIEDLQNTGLLKTITLDNARNPVIPNDIYYSSTEVQKAYLNGLIDGLGSEGRATAVVSSIMFYTSNRSFCEKIQQLLSAVGYKTEMVITEMISHGQTRPVYNLKNMDALYDKCWYYDEIKEIEKANENTVPEVTYDLRLEKEHLFWANMLYTHNSGRRGALMLSINDSHPDIMRFIWCKADPERVFDRDFLNKNISQKKIAALISDKNFPNKEAILSECSAGKLPSIDGANISVKFSDEFMKQVDEDCQDPWMCKFPDFDADLDFYNQHWDGHLDNWIKQGGKVKIYDRYSANVTDANKQYFVGHQYLDPATDEFVLIESIDQLTPGRYIFKMPTAKQIFLDACTAAWMRGDPGVLFWDRVIGWTTINNDHPKLRMESTNPCLSGRTKIAVADGRGPVPIEQLVAEGKDVPVYTQDPYSGKIIVKMGRNPRKTAENQQLYRVTFDDGSSLEATGNHRVILQDHRTVPVEDLKAGDICYPLFREKMSPESKKNSLSYWIKGFKPTRWTEHRLICDFRNKVREKIDLPSRIVTMPNGSQKLYVTKVCEHCKNEFEVAYTSRHRHACSMECARQLPSFVEKVTRNRKLAINDFMRHWERIKQTQVNCLNTLKAKLKRLPLYKEFVEEADRTGVLSRLTGYVYGFKNYGNLVAAAEQANHRVVSIEKIHSEDVYNLTVEDTHVFFAMTDFGTSTGEQYVLLSNCSEVSLQSGGACLLGAHVLSKYVYYPWSDQAVFDIEKWKDNTSTATILMNIFSQINEHLHPLEEQRQAETYARRIGIEFTGLADTLSMLGYKYGDHPDTVKFVKEIMKTKAQLEFVTSKDLAIQFGPNEYYTEQGEKAVDILFDKDYVKNLFDADKNKEDYQELKESVKVVGGIRNIAMNTVGPTGSLSILANNCSSGIEPVFALFYQRNTRVGDRQTYTVCHAPIAKRLLETVFTEDPDAVLDTDQIVNMFNVQEAHTLGYKDRVAIQAACQEYCDSSISSTVNLPEDCTPEEIMEIYSYAAKQGLKGITVYRDGSLTGVLNVIKESTDTESGDTDPQWGDVVEMPSVLRANRHEVHWNGCKFYIVVSVDEYQRPMEIFISSLPRQVSMTDDVFNNVDYQEKVSLWSALMRITSVALRSGTPVDHIVTQYRKASFFINDMMSIIARVLQNYVVHDDAVIEMDESGESTNTDSNKGKSKKACPQCGEYSLRHEGGCVTCQSCGYDKCS